MKCFLSGMPDLKLGLNDKIGLEKESQLKSRPTKRWFSFGHGFPSFFLPIVFSFDIVIRKLRLSLNVIIENNLVAVFSVLY